MSEFDPEQDYKYDLITQAFGEYQAMCASASVMETCDPLIRRMEVAISIGEVEPQLMADTFIVEANVILSYQLRNAFHKILTEKSEVAAGTDHSLSVEVARLIFEKHHQLN
jgi:hypothetical protein